MPSIKISIIIPSLNSITFLEECLESVLQQTLREIEVICVDAGSTDGTLDVINSYMQKDTRVKLVLSDKKSYGYQVNQGIIYAKGEYIGIVETDDYIAPEMYEKLYTATLENKVDYVKSGFTRFCFSKNQAKYCFVKNENEKIKNVVGKYCDLLQNRELGMIDPVHIWSGIYRREFLLKNKIQLNETAGASYQDTSFSLLVGLIAENCIYTEDCLYFYRIDNENSSVKSKQKIRCVIDEYDYLIKYLNLHKVYTAEIQNLIERYKLETYLWNYSRLNREGKSLFLQMIKEEMQPYVVGDLQWTPDENDNYKINVLTQKIAIEDYENQEKSRKIPTMRVVSEIEKGKQYHVAAAGRYCKSLLLLQEIWDKKFVLSISDNAKEKQNRKMQEYVVTDIETMARQYLEENWIIACNNYKGIKEQLKKLGIREERIVIFDKVLSFPEMVHVMKNRG